MVETWAEMGLDAGGEITTVQHDTPLATVITLMAERNLSVVPVLDNKGEELTLL